MKKPKLTLIKYCCYFNINFFEKIYIIFGKFNEKTSGLGQIYRRDC